jgi:hypothetical protein
MKRHLLVFEDGSDLEINLQKFVDSLDAAAEMYTLDVHVCFLKSELSAAEISDRFIKFAGSSLFFIADVSSSDCAGRMFGGFWDFIKSPALQAAAE